MASTCEEVGAQRGAERLVGAVELPGATFGMAAGAAASGAVRGSTMADVRAVFGAAAEQLLAIGLPEGQARFAALSPWAGGVRPERLAAAFLAVARRSVTAPDPAPEEVAIDAGPA